MNRRHLLHPQVMLDHQTISRLSFVLPAVPKTLSDAPASHSDPCQEVLVDAIGRAVRPKGVQLERHFLGRTGHGGVRSDLAIWLPDSEGRIVDVDRHEISADFHGVYVPNLEGALERVTGYDILFVHHETMKHALHSALQRSSISDCLIVCNPFSVAGQRAVQNRASKNILNPELTVMIDVREDFELLIERTVFQLALTKSEINPVFLVPHTSQARHRLRHLCERHQLPAFLASGPHAITDSAWDIDDFLGRPKWAEMLVLAMSQTPVAYWNTERSDADPVLQSLIDNRSVTHLSAGILQLAVELEKRYSDKGGVVAQGQLLNRQLFVEPKAFLDGASSCLSKSFPSRKRHQWEPVGPHVTAAPASANPVAARESNDAKTDDGSGVEAALLEMKRRLGLSEESP